MFAERRPSNGDPNFEPIISQIGVGSEAAKLNWDSDPSESSFRPAFRNLLSNLQCSLSFEEQLALDVDLALEFS